MNLLTKLDDVDVPVHGSKSHHLDRLGQLTINHGRSRIAIHRQPVDGFRFAVISIATFILLFCKVGIAGVHNPRVPESKVASSRLGRGEHRVWRLGSEGHVVRRALLRPAN